MKQFIKINTEGKPDLLIRTNDKTLQFPGEGTYVDVTDTPTLQNIDKLSKEYSVEVKKDKSGEIEEILFKVKKENKKDDVELNKTK